MTKKKPPITARLNRLKFFLSLATLFLGIILLHLQVFKKQTFLTFSKKNFLRKRALLSRRGAITDRNGILLATDRPINSLIWKGQGQKKLTKADIQLLSFIKKHEQAILPTEKQITTAERYKKEITLIDDISFTTLSKILEQYGDNNHLHFHTKTMRYYPEKECACHTVGSFRQSMHSSSTKALMGIEKLFEEQLKGVPGKEELVVDSLGRCIEQKTLSTALHGTTIKTTIDIFPQKIAENILKNFHAGTIIVMDPEQGDLIVLASSPTFDPNLFTQPISPEQWQNYINKKPFINRALGSCYPPASLFKLVTAAAALEEKIITPETMWNCTGSTRFGTAVFHCNRRYGHGPLLLDEGIAYSCNIPFYEIGKKITIETLARYAESFGFGKATGILLPERTGLVPTAQWKEKIVGKRWQKGETVLVSIGQSYSLVTPLQTVRFIAALGSGRLVRPRILLQEDVQYTPLSICQETRNALLSGMKKSVEKGTARLLKTLPNVEIYGKTGTAQVCSRSKKLSDSQETSFQNHGWFVGYIIPTNEKPFVLMVFLEHAGSARVAVQTAKKFLTEWKL